jgi:hypothetical protein
MKIRISVTSPTELLVAERLRDVAPKGVSDRTVRRLTRAAVSTLENALIEQAKTAPAAEVPGLVRAISLLNGDLYDEAAEILTELRADTAEAEEGTRRAGNPMNAIPFAEVEPQ